MAVVDPATGTTYTLPAKARYDAGTPLCASCARGATHDFNGDGKSDILWRDSSGNIAMWLMNGSTVSSGPGLGQISTAWSIVGQRDFDGDGKSDILWRDTSGNIAMWLMNGAHGFLRSAVSARSPPPGRSSGRETSTATARATFSGVTPAATSRSG